MPVLTIMRILAQPRVAVGSVRVGVDFLQLALTVGVLAFVLLIASGKKPRANGLSVGSTTVAAVGMVTAGVFMIVSAVTTLTTWLFKGVMPYLTKPMLTDIDVALVYLLTLIGMGGGVFLLLVGCRWFVRRRPVQGILRVAALLPVVWMWVRIARYEISYVSSLSVFRSVYDLLLLVVEMLFFLALAKYVLGVQETTPRALVGLSLGAAMMATMSWAVRVAMLIAQNKAAFDTCGLGTSADLGIAVLGFLVAFAYAGGAQEQVALPSAVAEEAKGEGSEELWSLLTDQDLLLGADGNEEEFVKENEEPRRPLELEDIINDIVLRHQNGKK